MQVYRFYIEGRVTDIMFYFDDPVRERDVVFLSQLVISPDVELHFAGAKTPTQQMTEHNWRQALKQARYALVDFENTHAMNYFYDVAAKEVITGVAQSRSNLEQATIEVAAGRSDDEAVYFGEFSPKQEQAEVFEDMLLR